MNRTASTSWHHRESDPQRLEILAAADRLLSGKPKRSSGNLSVSQLAVEARVKYWIVAQKHTDLRDHFQLLAVAARSARDKVESNHDPLSQLRRKHSDLLRHCESLERLVRQYALVINELTQEIEELRSESPRSSVSSIRSRQEIKGGVV